MHRFAVAVFVAVAVLTFSSPLFAQDLESIAGLPFEGTSYLWPDGDRAHPFVNAGNALLILKYSSIYGIAAVGYLLLSLRMALGEVATRD